MAAVAQKWASLMKNARPKIRVRAAAGPAPPTRKCLRVRSRRVIRTSLIFRRAHPLSWKMMVRTLAIVAAAFALLAVRPAFAQDDVESIEEVGGEEFAEGEAPAEPPQLTQEQLEYVRPRELCGGLGEYGSPQYC
jgi:hypothetical protein